MWWFEKRRNALSVIVTVILLELVGSQWNSGGVVANPHPVVAVGSSVISRDYNGGESFRTKRDQKPTNVDGNGAKGNGTNGGDMLSTTSGGEKNVSNPVGGPGPSSTVTMKGGVKEKTLFIPDRSPANITIAQMKEPTDEDDADLPSKRPDVKGDFDDKAVQRTIIVITGIAVIVVAYLGLKFVLIKRRKVVKRYGRIEASEMDLLDEVEDDGDSDEEEELFDINQQRRS